MTTPSRRAEIRRRQTRKRKMAVLRRRYAAAKTQGDRDRLIEKTIRLSPRQTADTARGLLEHKKA